MLYPLLTHAVGQQLRSTVYVVALVPITNFAGAYQLFFDHSSEFLPALIFIFSFNIFPGLIPSY